MKFAHTFLKRYCIVNTKQNNYSCEFYLKWAIVAHLKI
jgi:hypothetical protein